MKSNTKMNIYYATVTVACLTGAMLTGCAEPANVTTEKKMALGTMEQLQYTKDKRTGFCFASVHAGSAAGMMTMVPCSAEVEQIIHGDIK